MTTQEPEDKLAGARKQALAQYESIAEMVAKLRAADDDDAYEEMAEELAKEAGYVVREADANRSEPGFYWTKSGEGSGDPRETEAEAWVDCCDYHSLRPDADEARREIEEDALSVQVRSGWYSPGEKPEPEEYEILLCTGGPAVRMLAIWECTTSPTARALNARIGSRRGPKFSTG